MKAAVIHAFGEIPKYEDFADPVARDGDVPVDVRAVPLENFDKLAASGTHFGSAHSFPQFPAIVGHIGVGVRPDGALVPFGGVHPPYGALAERAVIPAAYAPYITPVPESVDPAVAAALPAPALTSLLPLKFGEGMQPDTTVLINGATGVSGKLAIQIARLLGAKRVIGTGREDASLQTLRDLGADTTIDLTQSDDALVTAFTQAAGDGYDIILDYVWGRPTELLLKALTPKTVGFAPRRIRYFQIGQSAGATLTMSADMLRTSGLELSGASPALAAAVPEAMKLLWQWLAERKLTIDVVTMPLREIATAWTRKTAGERIVIVP